MLIESLLTHTVSIQKLGRDPVGGGVASILTTDDVPALVQGHRNTMTTDRNGREVQAIAQVFLSPHAPIDPAYETGYRIVFQGRAFEVLAVERERDALTGYDGVMRLLLGTTGRIV